jgi:uncharacterized protein (DUF697 family)
MVQERTELETTDSAEVPVVAVPAGSDTAELTIARRDELASKLVDRFSLYSGAAGLIPLPFIDLAAVAGVQLQMLRRLSEIYGVPFSDNLGKSLVAGLAGTAIPATTAAAAAGSALKSVPVVGTGVGALTMSAGSAGATYLIGKFFIQHFASGGTLLDLDLSHYSQSLKTQTDKLKGRTETLKGYAEIGSARLKAGAEIGSARLKAGAEIGSAKLKAGAERLKTRFRPSPPAAASEPAAAPAQPATSTNEA